jgi:PPOX class probable FMN-dependent enzyme
VAVISRRIATTVQISRHGPAGRLRGVHDITTEAELTELLGEPTRAAVAKERTTLDELDRRWLAASPFCLVATSGADGSCDVSPKGDPPGFALVLDDRTIALPERAGNRRADGYRNVLANPHVGLLFAIPGRGDTLRVNGRPRLPRDPELLDRMVVRGHRPLLALVVEVQQVFSHCAKAFLRSGLWEPASWAPDAVPSRAEIAHRLERRDERLEDIERYYGEQYSAGLYPTT